MLCIDFGNNAKTMQTRNTHTNDHAILKSSK